MAPAAEDEQEHTEVQLLWRAFDKKMQRFLPAREVAEFLGLEPGQVGLAFVVFMLGFLLFGIGGNLITQLVGFVYPAYESFKALEPDEEKRENPRMMRTWLTYWIVYSLFSVLEVFVDYILYWVPLYYLLKLVFLVWLMIPKLGGAELVYNAMIKPMLRQYRKRIDVVIDDAHGKIAEATKGMDDVANKAKFVATAVGGKVAATAAAAAAKTGAKSEKDDKEE
jgi:receptor expression-enhancing protein 5/6